MDPDIPNPDPDPLTQLNPDPSRQVYFLQNSFLKAPNKPPGGRAVRGHENPSFSSFLREGSKAVQINRIFM
jgi:hypothetical protein